MKKSALKFWQGRSLMDVAPVPKPVPAVPPPPPVVAAWPRSAQLTTAFLLGVLTTLLGVHAWGYTRWGSRPTEFVHGPGLTYRVDLNRADRTELLQLPGVGDTLAGRIETHRRERGGF